MIILAMAEQIPGGVQYQPGAELTIIRDPWVKLHDMFHPHLVALEIPVTLFTLNLVLTILFYLTYRWVPLIGKRIQFGGADHFHHLYQFGIYLPSYFDVGSPLCLDCRDAWRTFAWLTWLACRVVIHTVFYQQRF